MHQGERARGAGRRLRRWPWLVLGLPAAVLLAAGLVLTDATPAAGGDAEAPVAAPTPEQAAAAQAVLQQLHAAMDSTGPAPISASAAQLAAVAAVASSALRPDRLALGVDAFGVHAQASHRLPLGRWLNAAVDLGESAGGPPPVTVTVGSVSLPPALARAALKLTARMLRARGFEVPDPATAVRWLRVDGGQVLAEVDAAGSRELVRAAAGAWRGGDEDGAAAVYCRLAAQQRQAPTARFSVLVRRAFAMPVADDVAGANRDALVALAMLVVDPRVGLLGGVTPDEARGCWASGDGAAVQGRTDSPKHWAMSAALAVTSGAQLSQAAGEWKELADSVSSQRAFGPGDASGFSLADIGADRAGELIALAATDPARAAAVRKALADADDEMLLPKALLALGDGMSAEAFARTYGSTDDPRYRRVRERIDEIVRTSTPARQ